MQNTKYNNKANGSSNHGGSNTTSLRQLQIAAIIKMLNYNESEENYSSASLLSPTGANFNKKEDKPLWKILIFDEYCQDLISLILRVNDLREHGVTLHLPLNSKRMPIADVPAIYFLRPNQVNIQKLIQDLSSNLYDSSYINFSSMLPRPLLETFANGAVKENCTDKVSQIYDQYLSFLCPEPNLFTLNINNSYRLLNSSTSSDEELDEVTTQIADGLLSVLVTTGQIPIIKASRGNAAEMVARKLNTKLGEFTRSPTASLSSQDSLFRDNSNAKSRAAVVIVDRNMDLIPMFSHSWNYQPLIHDLLDLTSNRVTVELEENNIKSIKKYDIDTKDFFWSKNYSKPILEIATEISQDLDLYRKEAEEITRLSGKDSLEEAAQFDFSTNTQQLKNAINALPELTARKLTLDNHMNIASCLFKEIEKRHIDQLFEMEDSILRKNKQNILELIQDPEFEPKDKLRLFLVYYLSHPNMNSNDIQSFEEALKDCGCDLTPFEALKKIKKTNSMSILSAGNANTNTNANKLTSQSNDLLDRFNFLGNQFRDGAYDKIYNKLRSLIPIQKDLALTKLVQSIVEPNSNPNNANLEELIHLDPKSRSPITRTSSPLANINGNFISIHSVIVFVVGGGSYIEMINLEEYQKKMPGLKSIIYGSTELLNPNQFIEQLKATL